MGCTGGIADFEFHEAFGGKADHLSEHAGVGAFRQERA